MNTDELAELLLAAIYYETEDMGHPYIFFSLQEVATNLGAGEMTNVLDAAQLLESKGFALLSQSSPNDLGIMITNDGSLFAEKGGETGIIEEYREYKEKMDGAQPKPGNLSREETFAPHEEPLKEGTRCSTPEITSHNIIMEIMHALINDDTLDIETRDYLLKDVDALNTQLSKQARNTKLVEMLLNNLGNQPSIKDLVAKLSSLI